MKKRGFLSIWVIISVILALIVLIVILSIGGAKFHYTSKTLQSCEIKNGVCVKPEDCKPFGTINFKCDEESYVCCLDLK